LRFLLDVNVGTRIAAALSSAGHDVVRMALTNATAEDGDILTLAVDSDRILVTYDRDFGELVFARAAATPPAIIYLRYRSRDVDVALARLLTVLEFETLKNHLTVIDERHIRRSPFPLRRKEND
jgi:predicted nuclease of predicted toxin-antitoxin system